MSSPNSANALAIQLTNDRQDMERRAKRRLAVMGLLIVFVAGYLSWIYSHVARLDASEIGLITRGYASEHMPELQAKLRQTLKERAPEFTDIGKQALLNAPRVLREWLEATVPFTELSLAQLVEKELDDQIETMVQQVARLARDGKPPGANVTIQELVQDARVAFAGMALSITSDGYREYASAIQKLNGELQRLQSGSKLNTKEQAQKAIIEASLVLLDRYQVTNAIAPDAHGQPPTPLDLFMDIVPAAAPRPAVRAAARAPIAK